MQTLSLIAWKNKGEAKMKVTVAMDSFKGSVSSIEAGEAAANGIRRVYPEAEIAVRPLADGGEGTTDTLVRGMGGRKQRVKVRGPLGECIECEYGILEKEKTAVIEIACAAGLTLVPEQMRNPLLTTTYGVGEMIRDGIQRGCRKFLIGIGGSATNDGGVGMLQALGYDFLDTEGKQIRKGAAGLAQLKVIKDIHVLPELKECQFRIACDVTNPLCGEHGCSAVYGPQKGADAAMIKSMDAWLARYASMAKEKFQRGDKDYPGAGAAGGLGFAFLTFMNADLQPGIQIVMEETQLEAYIKEADLVITGEGKLDGQTAMGKAPVGIARLAKKYGKPVIAFAGSIEEDASRCEQEGIDAFFCILPGPVSLKEAMKPEDTKKNISAATEQVLRLWKLLCQ